MVALQQLVFNRFQISTSNRHDLVSNVFCTDNFCQLLPTRHTGADLAKAARADTIDSVRHGAGCCFSSNSIKRGLVRNLSWCHGDYSLLRGRIRANKTLLSRLLLIGFVSTLLLLTSATKEQLSTVTSAIASSFQPEVNVSQFDTSNRARFETYQTGFALFVANPVTGVGPGNYSIASNSGEGATSHNLYLDIAAEMGLPGLFLFASILLMSLLNFAYTSRRSQDSIIRALSVGWIATIAALMFYWMFTSYFFEPKLNMLVWLILGLSVALREITNSGYKLQKVYSP